MAARATSRAPEHSAAPARAPLPGTARRFGLIVVGGAAVGVTMLLLRPPVENAYPPCPFRSITGLDCPLCGGMRCVAALAHGDVATAFDFNALVALTVPLALILGVAALVLGPRAQPLVDALFAKRVLLAGAAVVMAFFVLRLMPFAEWLTTTA